MNLQSLPKQTLLSETEKLVREERKITTTILWHLFEIERRRLFAELGYASLYEYCTLQLKYSASGAMRRIDSMRLLKEMPELESKIESGVLNVTAIGQAQTLFKQARREQKPFTLEAKRELVSKLESKSTRECEKIIAEVAPEMSKPSRERVVSATKTEIRFEAGDSLYSKIQAAKAKHAHKLKGSNDFADLLEILLDQALEEKKLKQSVPAPEVKSTRSRYIPMAVRQNATKQAQGKCTYVDPVTKRACGSSFALQLDHIKPLAAGGKTETENIRVLCRAHNLFEAQRLLGKGRPLIHGSNLSSNGR